MPVVYNKKNGNIPSDAVYVGRPTKFGNPYSHLDKTIAKYKCSSRAEAIKLYEQWLTTQPALIATIKKELKGKNLVCWCVPLACHADILIKIANEKNDTPIGMYGLLDTDPPLYI